MIKLELKFIIILLELLLFTNFIKNSNEIPSIKNYSLNNNKSKFIIYLQNRIFKILKKNISKINTLYINSYMRFGNYIISLNNAIIFCEFLSCKRIIIGHHKYLINHKIFYQKYNLTIESNYQFNYTDNNSMAIKSVFFFAYLNFTDLGKINRFFVFRKEIINNLPKVEINFNDLYLYIRGGDIFRHINETCQYYYQPPLCFYKRILNQFIFRKVIIISEDKLNPIIPMLLNEYSFIKYNKNNIKLDISYLVNSYNIISAISSFLVSIIKLNQNLKFLWEYDFYETIIRYKFLHYSVYTFSFNYTIYKMNPSENYKKFMYPFLNSAQQRNLMIEEKCENDFQVIPPKIS